MSRVNKKKKGVVARLDASDLAKIEEMKKSFVYVGKPVFNRKPSLIVGSVWLESHVDMSGFEDLDEFNRCLFWYRFLSKYFDEEFSI